MKTPLVLNAHLIRQVARPEPRSSTRRGDVKYSPHTSASCLSFYSRSPKPTLDDMCQRRRPRTTSHRTARNCAATYLCRAEERCMERLFCLRRNCILQQFKLIQKGQVTRKSSVYYCVILFRLIILSCQFVYSFLYLFLRFCFWGSVRHFVLTIINNKNKK